MRKIDTCKFGKKAITIIAVFAMIFCGLVGMNAQIGKAEVFGTDVQVSVDSRYRPALALSTTGTIYVAFQGYGGYGTDIGFSKSTDNGSSFSLEICVCYETEWAYTPAVAAYGENNVYVVWRGSDDNIYYARSTNGGNSFEPKVRVSDAKASVLYGPDIAVDSNGVIYVVWAGAGVDSHIYIDKSTDGATFGTDVAVNPTPSVIASPSIAIDSSNNILVAFDASDEIFFTKSTDSGSTFSSPVRVDDSTGGTKRANYPSIGVDADGKIFVAWQDYRNVYADIYVAVSSDGGATFSAGVKVNDDTTDTHQTGPSLAVHPCGKVFVAWDDKRNGGAEIYFANSTDGGATFGVNVKVSDVPPAETYDHLHPSLVVGPDTEVYIVWEDRRSGAKIYFDKAPDATWPKAVADLAVVGATENSITINWTAPGDNFALGTATTYDIRYSTSAITDANWAGATPATPPTPQAGGTKETLTVTGLNNDTTYYFALKTADEIPNWSPLSKVASGKTLDDWAPARVTDLTASEPTSNSIKLTWTAPGDNGNTGTATKYDIRYNTIEVNDITWDNAIQCTDVPAPSVAGTTETFVVTGLSPGTTYYFALKTADEVPNRSLISNVASATTVVNLPPNAPILTAPANDTWTNNSKPTFTWTFSDQDVGDVQAEYLWEADNNSDFSSPEYRNQTISAISSYTPTTAIADGIWYWRVKTKDDKGEWGPFSTYRIIKIDTIPPTGSIVINDDADKTNTTAVTLTLTYSDGLGSGVDKVRYSNDGVWDTEEWEDATPTKSWTLTPGDGVKTVYYQIKDKLGLMSTTYNDTIKLDTAATTKITETTTGAEVTAYHTGTGTINVRSVSSPGDAPPGKIGIGKFVDVTKDPTLTISWVYIKIPYTAAGIPADADESSLKMYYWTGTEWKSCEEIGTTGVDIENKFVWANVTHLTIFAPMADKVAAPINWALYGGIAVAIIIILAVAIIAVKKKKIPKKKIPKKKLPKEPT